MNLKSQIRRWVALLAALAVPSALNAQACPMCYASAAASSPGLLHAIKVSIFVIMLPCLAMFAAIFAVIYKRRASFNASGDDGADLNFELREMVKPPWTPALWETSQGDQTEQERANKISG